MNKIDLQPRAVIKELQENIKGLTSKASLKVGFFESSRYDNGTYVAEVARDNEYGTLKIPPRPFFRNAIDENTPKWVDFLGRDLVNTNDAGISYNRLGEMARGDIVESITRLNTPPNAQRTIEQKGSSNPLIDTGFLRANVTFKVD